MNTTEKIKAENDEFRRRIRQENLIYFSKWIAVVIVASVLLLWGMRSLAISQFNNLMEFTETNNCTLIEANSKKWSNELVYQCGDMKYRKDVSNYVFSRIWANR